MRHSVVMSNPFAGIVFRVFVLRAVAAGLALFIPFAMFAFEIIVKIAEFEMVIAGVGDPALLRAEALLA